MGCPGPTLAEGLGSDEQNQPPARAGFSAWQGCIIPLRAIATEKSSLCPLYPPQGSYAYPRRFGRGPVRTRPGCKTVKLPIKRCPRLRTTSTTVAGRLRRTRAGNRIKITPPVFCILA